MKAQILQGVRIWATVLILAGGFTSLITVLEVIDSIRFYGLDSIFIDGFISMVGFLVYGVTPLMLYSTGMGLFLSRPWARLSSLFMLPILLFLFFANQASQVAARFYPQLDSPQASASNQLDVYIKFLVMYGVFSIPMVLYFSRPEVRNFFLIQSEQES